MVSEGDLHKIEVTLTGTLYHKAVSFWMYLLDGTQPGISYAVALLAKFVEKPCRIHWNAVRRILWYLNETRTYRLRRSFSLILNLHEFIDSDWAGVTNSCMSTSGYTFTMCRGAVSWSSCQQEAVFLSSAEANYVSLFSNTKESIGLRCLWCGIKKI